MAAGDLTATNINLGFKKCAVFDGIDDQINLPLSAVNGIDDSGFTVGFWVNADFTNSEIQDIRLFNSEHTGGGNSEFRTYHNLTVGFYVSNGAGFFSADAFLGGTPPADNTWIFINYKVTYDPTTNKSKVYAGNSGQWLSSSALFDGKIILPDTELLIGEWQGGTNHFEGMISNFMLFNKPMSTEEITSVYNGSISQFKDNLILHYRFNGDYKDSSGNGQDGTNGGTYLTNTIGNKIKAGVKVVRNLAAATDKLIVTKGRVGNCLIVGAERAAA